ncbi:MAG: hypothetical protein ACREBA_05660 [Nitrosotalea sp.]
MSYRKKDFKCNGYGMRFNACVGLETHSKVAPPKHDGFEQTRYWGN